jgi:DNA repair protein RecN (Recombination protein N)
MIDELVVTNLGVVASARVCPGPGLTVITGETGAGKTVLVEAVRLLAGADPRPGLVGPASDEAIVEARIVGDEELVVSRRIPRSGRTRAYINGGLASAKNLNEALEGVIEVVGQHDQMSLSRPSETLGLVDSLLDDPGRKVRDEERATRHRQRELTSVRDRLGGDRRALTRELELVRYQAQEIDRARLTPDDDIELDRIASRLRNAASLTELLSQASGELELINDRWGITLDLVRKSARFDTSLSDLASRLEAAGDTQTDLAREVRHQLESLDVDATELEAVEARLTLIGDLKRKYGADLEEVLAFGKEARRRSEELENLLDEADTVESDLLATATKLERLAARMKKHRQVASKQLVAAALAHLKDLGLANPTLALEIDHNRAQLLFASDPGLEPGPVDRVASGGELSRLILSLRLAAGVGDRRALVFDEVDAGIGGATALAMGRKLAALSADRQVLCVTHLPQVAAFGGVHYRLVRVGDRAEVAEVRASERQGELSRMLAGLPDSEGGREAAAELLSVASADSAPG